MVRLSPLGRKLWRDVGAARGQLVAIASVIAAGVALFVLMLSTFESLDQTKRTYYEQTRFADVFASLVRAPTGIEREIARIPGVARVETRVVADATLSVPAMVEPAGGRVISIQPDRHPINNDVVLRSGRWISRGRPDEVLASEGFARAHQLAPGDTVTAVIRGHQRRLRIVGLALAPEYVYAIRPGQLLPDERLFGIFWMDRDALAAALDLRDACNDITLALDAGALPAQVIERLDRVLEPYGGLGAIPRARQISNFYLESELASLRGAGEMVPAIFLGVAAFLLHVVLARIVATQREQIGALKALGYGRGALGRHYLGWGLVVAVLGGVAGVALGAWLGRSMTRFYTSFFHFPILRYHLPARVTAEAALGAVLPAVFGTLNTARRVARLAPAEAMRPEPPALHRRGALARIGHHRILSQPARIVLRNLTARPLRTVFSVLGIAASGALLVVGNFSWDAIQEMTSVRFSLAERYDAMLSFTEPRSASAVDDVRHLPGVVDAEGFRAVAARLRHGTRSRTAVITGLPAHSALRRVVDDARQRAVVLPPEGLVLGTETANLLGVSRGDRVTVHVLEGHRPVRVLTVNELVNESMGTNVYLELGALRRLLQEGDTWSGAFLRLDSRFEDALFRRVKSTPVIAGVTLKRALLENFRQTVGKSLGTTRLVTVLFAAVMAFGVVYNAARVSLSERARELASLRVMGFRRSEISYVLLGELGIITLFAIPLGLLLGYGLAAATVHAYQTEVYRLPLVILPRTYVMSAVTVLGAATLSGLVVRRKLDHLDLVEVLKLRE